MNRYIGVVVCIALLPVSIGAAPLYFDNWTDESTFWSAQPPFVGTAITPTRVRVTGDDELGTATIHQWDIFTEDRQTLLYSIPPQNVVDGGTLTLPEGAFSVLIVPRGQYQPWLIQFTNAGANVTTNEVLRADLVGATWRLSRALVAAPEPTALGTIVVGVCCAVWATRWSLRVR